MAIYFTVFIYLLFLVEKYKCFGLLSNMCSEKLKYIFIDNFNSYFLCNFTKANDFWLKSINSIIGRKKKYISCTTIRVN